MRVRVLFMPAAPGNPYLQLLADGLAAHGVEVRATRGAGHLFPFIQAVVRGPRPDVFHLHWTYPYLYWPGTGRLSRLLALRLLVQLRLLRRLGIRIVWTMHNISAHESDDPRFESHISRRVGALCDSIVVHCEAARQAAQAELGPDSDAARRLVVVPHGHYIGAYPDDLSREEARATLALSPNDRVFVMFGRLRRYKGTQELLGAFRQLPDPSARLILAGKCRTPDLRREVQELAAGDERVQARLEFVPDHEVQRYLRAADVAVLPFRDVLTSGSAVLAMSFGLPVVAPSLGCLPETLAGQPQLLYDPTDEGALGRALQAALKADLPALGTANRAAVEAHDWAGVAGQTISLAYRPQPSPVAPESAAAAGG